MFICDGCKKKIGPCAHLNRLPVKSREKTYPLRKYKDRKGNEIMDRGGQGHEIIQEQNFCDSCTRVKKEKPDGHPNTGE